MIKAIIFDLNGIFIQSPKLSERFEKDFNVPVQEFVPKLSEVMDKVRQKDAGKAFEYWKPKLENWNIEMSEEKFWNYWFGAEVVSEAMVNFARELKSKGIKVFVLSNNFKERANYYDQYPWMHDTVDKAYFSWQTGFIKPDPMAWQSILEDNNLKPDECLYFDDQEKNVRASESVGIKAFVFSNEKELQDKIKESL